jgi:hypothetical protein
MARRCLLVQSLKFRPNAARLCAHFQTRRSNHHDAGQSSQGFYRRSSTMCCRIAEAVTVRCRTWCRRAQAAILGGCTICPKSWAYSIRERRTIRKPPGTASNGFSWPAPTACRSRALKAGRRGIDQGKRASKHGVGFNPTPMPLERT